MKINDIFENIAKDIHNKFQGAAETVATKNIINLYKKTKDVLIANKKNETSYFKHLKYKVNVTQTLVAAYVFVSEKRVPNLKNVIMGVQPIDIKSWRQEKDKIIRWIKKTQLTFGAFAHITTKRQYNQFAYFIWRKQRKFGIPPFDFFGLAVNNAGGIEYLRLKIYRELVKSLKLRLNKMNKTYNVIIPENK